MCDTLCLRKSSQTDVQGYMRTRVCVCVCTPQLAVQTEFIKMPSVLILHLQQQQWPSTSPFPPLSPSLLSLLLFLSPFINFLPFPFSHFDSEKQELTAYLASNTPPHHHHHPHLPPLSPPPNGLFWCGARQWQITTPLMNF